MIGSSLPKVGSPNPGKAGSDTAAEHRFVNQKIQNIKKTPITNAEFEPKNPKLKKKTPITSSEFEPKTPTFEN